MTDTIFTVMVSSITGIFTFFLGIAKQKRESDSIGLTNVEKSLTIYTTIITDLKGQIEELLVKVDELEAKVEELREENQELKEMLRNKK